MHPTARDFKKLTKGSCHNEMVMRKLNVLCAFAVVFGLTICGEQQLHAQDNYNLIRFRTPSSNIHCMFVIDENKTEPNGIACDITNRSNIKAILPKPKDCEFDWGQRFELGSYISRLSQAVDLIEKRSQQGRPLQGREGSMWL